MAKTLTVDLVELGPVAAASRAPCALSSTCSRVRESEVVSLLAEGASREDILAGVVPVCGPACGQHGGADGIWMETWCLWEASRKTWVCGGNCRSFSASSSLNYRVDPQLNGRLGRPCWPRRRIMATSSGAASRRQVSPAAGTRRSARASIRAVDDAYAFRYDEIASLRREGRKVVG